RYSNILVDVTGRELDDEGMIKMPLNLEPRQGPDWRATLLAALSRLSELQAAAEALYAESGRYIRPILLVQVQRTGREQRESGFIHADDAKEFLEQAGFAHDEIAIKTAQVDDLASRDEDLMSPESRVRAIITKQALQ